MGTVVSIDIRDRGPVEGAVAEVVRWLGSVDERFSTFRPESAVSRLARGELALEAADLDVRSVIAACERLRWRTGGYFDARYRAGGLDPSALVKGWAGQRAAELLLDAGIENFCLSLGGDVVTRGLPAPGRNWRIGIQHPHDRHALAATVEVTDAAIATSGMYERGHHVIDPHTGRPPTGVVSVTVIGSDLGLADAYSTAAFAMGIKGPDWTLGLRDVETMTILEGDMVRSTRGFPLVELQAA
jgi:thiamine biosynthesis lipoprotein